MRESFWSTFCLLARPFWTSKEKWYGIFLLGSVMGLSTASVSVAVANSNWSNAFWTSIQNYEKSAFPHLMFRFVLIGGSFILISTLRTYFEQTLSLRWRKCLTEKLVDDYFEKERFYFNRFVHHYIDNPDQRIAQDAGEFVDRSISLGVGILTHTTTIVSFSVIIWRLSGALTFEIYGLKIRLPGYMFWAAILYAAIGSALVHFVGRKLRPLNFNQQKLEADFRFKLIRVRENADSIALSDGGNAENGFLKRAFDEIYRNYKLLISKQLSLGAVSGVYSQLTGIIAVFLAVPKFFSKEITFGSLMQINSAFGQMQSSLSYFIYNYKNIAEYRAVVDRLGGLLKSFEEIQRIPQTIDLKTLDNPKSLNLTGLNLYLPSGQSLASSITLKLHQGKSLLVRGRSGLGKSTLIKLIYGLWPYGNGLVETPQKAEMMVIPHRPYLPFASLKEVLAYPRLTLEQTEAETKELLEYCRLGQLFSKLEVNCNWDQILSAGEQQRISFFRALVTKPRWLLLDEATSALDEESQTFFTSH